MLNALIIFSTCISCEIALHLPFGTTFHTLILALKKSKSVILSKHISDSRKEITLPLYSMRIFKSSSKLLLYLLLLTAPVVACVWIYFQNLREGLLVLNDYGTLTIITITSIVYLLLRLAFNVRLFRN